MRNSLAMTALLSLSALTPGWSQTTAKGVNRHYEVLPPGENEWSGWQVVEIDGERTTELLVPSIESIGSGQYRAWIRETTDNGWWIGYHDFDCPRRRVRSGASIGHAYADGPLRVAALNGVQQPKKYDNVTPEWWSPGGRNKLALELVCGLQS